MASSQLQLIHSDDSWKLDRHTIEVGRAGIAAAREALAKAHPKDEPIESGNGQLAMPLVHRAA
ncbi:MAG: hypothetical protein OES24_13255 [Acidimicrobiia bacterium]|nr:hypothetical protein [Acidimicrobiia bacterium]